MVNFQMVKFTSGLRKIEREENNVSVAELVDATDLKSVSRKGVWVRFPPLIPFNYRKELLCDCDY